MKKQQLIERILLNMNYNSSKTYSENLESIQIVEQSSISSGILNQQQQNNLISSVGASWREVGKPNFKVETQDEWYAVFAVWYAQQIETELMLKYGSDDTKGACKFNNKLLYPINNKNLTDYLTNRIKFSNPKDSDKIIEQSICYNDVIVYKKPFDKIDYNNLSSNGGRLDKTSFKNYNGYIPSYAEVIRAYGPNFTTLKNLIWKSDKKILKNKYTKSGKPYDASPIENEGSGVGNIFKGSQITSDGVHDFLTALEIGSAFIPGVGLGISFIVGLTDAFMYAVEAETQNDKSKQKEANETAIFALLLTILPELKLFTKLSQSSKSIYYSLIKKINSGNLKQISKEEIKFLNDITKWDLSTMSAEIKSKLKKMVVDAMKNKNIDKETYNSLNKFWKSLEGQHEFKDTLLGVVAGFGLSQKGRDFVMSLIDIFTSKGIEVTPKQVEEFTKTLKDVKDDEIKMEEFKEDVEKAPRETCVKLLNDSTYLNRKIEEYGLKKAREEIVPQKDTSGFGPLLNYE
jgi:hypothetical protein